MTLYAHSPQNQQKEDSRSLDIVFRFGMSGKFALDSVDSMQKHAHLNFFTQKDHRVLSFVDYRRFGKWEPGGDWGPDRGPCVISEYEKFRSNVLDNLDKAAFNRPICEALLNQSYFNGIGNYLRAEILHRCKIAPFECARTVLEPLKDNQVKSEEPDILQLCHILPNEVINLDYDLEDPSDHSVFSDWLQCYYNPSMKNVSDHNNRTIWFSGKAGPMAPKENRSRHQKKQKTQKNGVANALEDERNYAKKTRKLTRNKVKKMEEVNQEDIKIEVQNLVPKRKRKKAAEPELCTSPLKTRRQRAQVKQEIKEERLMSPYFAESVSQKRRSRRKMKSIL